MNQSIDIKSIYPIDEERLLSYYKRIEKKYSKKSPIEIGASFLISQSIGSEVSEIIPVLEYFQEKNPFGTQLIDFIFEWIRAQRIRLEYKKYLIRADYPENSEMLAVDDCISRFFVNYDKYIRNITDSNISDYILGTLYSIFFWDYSKGLEFTEKLKSFKEKIPPEMFDSISINAYTLRLSLSEIISNDYKGVVISRKAEKKQEVQVGNGLAKPKEIQIEEREFQCSLLEKTIKTYFIRKGKVDPKAINNASTQLLNSYFKSGELYEFLDFFQILIDGLSDTIYDALIDEFKDLYEKDRLRKLIRDILVSVKDVEESEILDGIAWINDLKPILNHLLIIVFEKVINFDILDAQEKLVCEEDIPKVSIDKIKDKIKALDDFDLAQLCTIDYTPDQFRTLLEDTLRESDAGLIKKRNYIREKMQGFKSELRSQ
jgi:hypothetical protein